MTRLTALDNSFAEPRKFGFIDALRGVAILAVILVHARETVAAGSPWLSTLMGAGARGVQLFYIASAMTLCLSWHFRATREQHPIRNFYLRRFFRIAPMFYLAIAGYLLLDGLAPRYFAPDGVRWYYVPLTALFLNGFHPETITSVVPGGWSIAVEMTFYLFFPFLVTRSRSMAWLISLLAVSVVAARAWGSIVYAVYAPSYPAEQIYLVDALAVLGFIAQFPVFVMGFIAFRLFDEPEHWAKGVALGAATLIAWLAIRTFVLRAPATDLLAQPIYMGGVFALFALALGRYPTRLLVNPVFIWIGKLSFSMYLTHFAVIAAFKAIGVSERFSAGDSGALLHYLLVVAATAGVSLICYRVIERPGIEFGRRLILRMESEAPSAGCAPRT
ncbi:MAG: acyltransferase [Cyanobacteria bacterium]|nr:acyltransferase [Cyanobacteriota bacterium]